MTSLERARLVADAILYEGYLLYPYRSTSAKNEMRWQFGVLGPRPGAGAAGPSALSEPPAMTAECLLSSDDALIPGDEGELAVYLRFLQLQVRAVEQRDPSHDKGFVAVDELVAGGERWLSWDEAVEREIRLGPFPVSSSLSAQTMPVHVDGSESEELLIDGGVVVGRILRRCSPLHGQVELTIRPTEDGNGMRKLRVAVTNTTDVVVTTRDEAIASSFIGAHLLLVAAGAEFVSLLDPPDRAQAAAAGCVQDRCFPVLAGTADDRHLVLVSPIILYDYPEVADESAGALYDSTEIDEILTLRVLTLTDEEKAAARATDPRAAAIIDRCDALSPEALQAMHGVLRKPHLDVGVPRSILGDGRGGFGGPGDLVDDTRVGGDGIPTWGDGLPWWDPGMDASVSPSSDVVVVDGVPVSKGVTVRLHPRRRADAQDLFFVDQPARVTGVFSDVDGDVHVAVVLANDPAADVHEWYGRYLYFAPEEIEPLSSVVETSVAPLHHPRPEES